MKTGKILIGIFSAGVLFRLVFWINGLLHIPAGSDEAIVGLMAKRIFSGEFPVMIWVQPHGGALEAYLTAPLYLLLRSSILTLRLPPLFYSAGFMVLIYLIGRDFFGRQAGLAGALLAAVPPAYVSLLGSLGITMNNPAFLGSAFILYMTHRVVREPMADDRKISLMALTGLVAGITFWVHLLVACAVLSAAFFMFLDDRLFFLRKHSWAFALSFALGSFPLWVFNFATNFSTFAMSLARDAAGAFEYLKTCLVFTLPRAWGMRVPVYIDNPFFLPVNRYFFAAYAAAALLLLIYGSAKRLRSLKLLLRRRGERRPDGAWLLLAVSAVCVAVFARASRSNAHSVRYIIYTYIGFIPIMGYALAEIFRKKKALACALGGIVLSFHLFSNILLMRAWASPGFAEERLNLPDNSELAAFLDEKGIDRGYMHYWLSYPLVFRTDERIIVSPAYDERFGRYVHPYLGCVEASDNAAFIFHPAAGLSPEWFERGFAAAGGSCSREMAGRFAVFYDFSPPVAGLSALDNKNFTVSASHNPEGAGRILDGDESTRWGTASPQVPGMFVEIGLDEVREISGISLHFGKFAHDYPRGLDIFVSRSGAAWKRVYSNPALGGSLYWAGGSPRIYAGGEFIRIVFEPVRGDRVKLVQTGSHGVFDWSIAKLEILEKK